MARDRITTSSNDLITDNGSVLLSLVQGEAQEMAIILDMVGIADTSYTYEAVLIEGSNDGAGTKPTTVETGGVEDTLTVRLCDHTGSWDAGTAYDREDVVDYTDGNSYRLLSGSARVSAITPNLDPLWELHDKRTLYVQFTDALSLTYTEQPPPDYAVYGFFELRVAQNADPVFVNTWKPVRGLIQVLFSPTELV